jgi:hypothetical protein
MLVGAASTAAQSAPRQPAGPSVSAVENRSYQLTVSRSVGDPAPYTDCISFTNTTATLSSCTQGATGLLITPNNALNMWIAIIPCNNLNLVIRGVSTEATGLELGLNTIGAVAFSNVQGWSYGMHGFQTVSCGVP